MDARRKKIHYRAWHRGMREMDLILGRFADQTLEKMDAEHLDDFERVLDCPDHMLLGWITGRDEVAPEFNNEFMGLLKRFHAIPE